MSDKRELFENFISRMDSEIENGRYFEASWYVYALLEDRLISMLRNSGGVPQPTRGRFLMLGAKVTHLSQRMANDSLLQAYFDPVPVQEWVRSRNRLMHGMANGTLPLSEIDKQKYLLATTGRDLIRDVSASAMRLKENRNKAN